MSLGSWLRGATRVRFDDRTLGNLTKNAAVVGGTVLGGPAGLALAGAGSALGQAALPGSNLRDILGAGVKGAATSGAVRGGYGLLKNAAGAIGGGGAADAASGAAGGSIPSPSIPPVSSLSHASGALAPIAQGAGGVPSSVLPPVVEEGWAAGGAGGGSGAMSALGKAGDFVEHHANAVGMGLQGLGHIATSGAENRKANAEADLLEQRVGESAYDLDQRKRREAAMQPLWSPLGTAFGQNYAQVAKNPYEPQVG